MSAISSIEWTDRTWNPVRGCSVISPGCVNCYAMKQAHRFSGVGKPYECLTKQTNAGPQWTGKIATIDKALLEPLSWRRPARVFVNSMSDLFHEDVPEAFIEKVFAVMAIASAHTFQILTKRAYRMRKWLEKNSTGGRIFHVAQQIDPKRHGADSGAWPLPNVWLGVSVEDQKRADERIPQLVKTPAAIRFISAEPLLGPLLLDNGEASWLTCRANCTPNADDEYEGNPCLSVMATGKCFHGIDWVIVGGESGQGARSFDIDWARLIVKQCREAEVPCFVKQLGSRPWRPGHTTEEGLRDLKDHKGGDMAEWPDDLRVRELPAVRV
jgi:protein gp37